MEEPLMFEVDGLRADLKATGESKAMDPRQTAKARRAAERLEGAMPATGRAGREHPLSELVARTEHARRRALAADDLKDARLLNAVLTELTLV